MPLGPTRFAFGPFEFDAATGELVRGNVTQRLRPKNARLLHALLDRAGQLVSRENLYAELWPRGGVELSQGLNASIRQLRKSLGDDASKPRFIQTLPRRGYRFIHPTRVLSEKTATRPARGTRFRAVRATLGGAAALLFFLLPHAETLEAPAGQTLTDSFELVHARYLLESEGAHGWATVDSLLSESIDLRTPDPAAWSLLGQLRFLQGRTGEARRHALEALRLAPHDPRAHLVLGDLAFDVRWDYEQARRHYRAASDGDPGWALPYRRLALVHLALADTSSALAALDQALVRDPVRPFVEADVGWVYLLSRRYEQADVACATSGAGAEVVACSFVVDLPELGGRAKLEAMGKPVLTLCAFEGK